MGLGYVARANRYCRGVLSGKIPACRFVKAACQRQIDDLARARKDKKWPYRFDNAKAAKVCRFAENLTHIKGEWAGKSIKLEDWQCFILTTIFGWVRRADGYRRFRDVYIEIARKNAKSTTAAIIGLYMLCDDQEFGAEIYSGATSLAQAMKVFEVAWLMVDRDLEMQEHFGITLGGTRKHHGPIYRLADGSKFEPVIGKPGDGASPSCGIVDEYHEHKSSELYDTLDTGMGARQQPLLLVITTAGFDLGGPCYAQRADVVRILEGAYAADDTFGIIFTVDDGDDWTSQEVLAKANPNLGVSVSMADLVAKQDKAKQSARLQGPFKTKHLNIWCQAASGAFDMLALERCIDRKMSLSDFEGEEAMAGLDLASKIDLTALVLLFRRMIDDEWHYYLFAYIYLPADTIEIETNTHYQAWRNDGLIIETDGTITDYRRVEDDVKDACERFMVRHLGFDQYNATDLAIRLEEWAQNNSYASNEKPLMVEVPQNVKFLSEPLKELDGLIRAGRFHWDGSPVVRWCFGNTEVKEDKNQNVFPLKAMARRENKIDVVLATLNALGRWLPYKGDHTSVYENRGVLSF